MSITNLKTRLDNQLSFRDEDAAQDAGAHFTGLPQELADKIFNQLSFGDAWKARRVNKEWKEAIERSPAIWRDMDLTVFIFNKREMAIEKWLKLALGRTKSLEFKKLQGTPYNDFKMRSIITKICRESPLLKELVIGNALPSPTFLSGLASPIVLTKLEIDSGASPANLRGLGGQLFLLVGLTFLVITLRPTSVFDDTQPQVSWPPAGKLEALKEVRIHAQSGRNEDEHWRLQAANIVSLAHAAPNLEVVFLEGFARDEHHSCNLGVMQNLKKLTMRLQEWMPVGGLPQSLEYLDAENIIVTPEEHEYTNEWEDAAPYLPNLKVLHINASPGMIAWNISFWAAMVEKSACQLHELRIGETHGFTHGTERDAESWELYSEGGIWEYQLLARLSGGGWLEELRVLQISSSVSNECNHELLMASIASSCPNLGKLIWTGHYAVSPEMEARVIRAFDAEGHRCSFEVGLGTWAHIFEYLVLEHDEEGKKAWFDRQKQSPVGDACGCNEFQIRRFETGNNPIHFDGYRAGGTSSPAWGGQSRPTTPSWGPLALGPATSITDWGSEAGWEPTTMDANTDPPTRSGSVLNRLSNAWRALWA